jgi:hypothetical protein
MNKSELVAAFDALAEWHDTKAYKARQFPGSAVDVMAKAAEVHDDAARRIRAALYGPLASPPLNHLPMPTLYLAGPMTGLPDNNYPAFHDATAQLRAAGFTVLNPAETELPTGEDSWENYMRAGLTQVLQADAVALLPDWWRSRGAQLEHGTAHSLGVPAYHWEAWLCTDWPLLIPGWRA